LQNEFSSPGTPMMLNKAMLHCN